MTDTRATPRRLRLRLPRLGRRRFWALAVIVSIVLIAAFFFLPGDGEWRYRRAAADADRLDPGWRYADLWANRPEVPDAENAAPLVMTDAKSLRAGWDDAAPWNWRLWKMPVERRLDPKTAGELTAFLRPFAAELLRARAIADRPRGRYEVDAPDVRDNLDCQDRFRPRVFEALLVARLLALDAASRGEAGDIEAAMRSSLAAVHAGTSLGTEPSLRGQRLGVGAIRHGVIAAERALAQGEVSDRTLALWQDRLKAESRVPHLLIGLRGERAAQDELFQKVRREELTLAAIHPAITARWPDRLFLSRDVVRANQADCLALMTRAVEIAKGPSDRVLPPLDALDREFDRTWRGSWRWDPRMLRKEPSITIMPHFYTARYMFEHHGVFFECARVAMGAERFRSAEGRWPKSLDELVPRFLDALPNDPETGGPLRMARKPESFIVYSVGFDRIDNGGEIDTLREWRPGNDIGFRLWDVDKRRQAPNR